MTPAARLQQWLHREQAPDTKGIFSRFEAFNRARRSKARSLLTPRQQLFLDFLPVYFHCNHPVLPGFQSLHTPAGVVGFTPDAELIERIHRHLSPAFKPAPAPERPAVEALFLMGSIGSIAHAASSDVDVWVCHGAALTAEERRQLRDKAEAISRHAEATLGLEIHFFLMCAEEFRAGEREALSNEDCGSTQHFLLLDEFYRSAIHLAGKIPLWWLIDPEDADYDAAKARIEKHSRNTLDFGTVRNIPPGEYVGAGIWQLFKAIRSPHKSLIKLLLVETYASDHPHAEPLSQFLKREIYAGRGDADALDPYLMLYRRAERYLQALDQPERLELLRRALYFKAEMRLSQLPEPRNWRQRTITSLVADWGWSREHIANLDMREHWRVRRMRQEHKELVGELTGSYRFLQEFARRTAAARLISSHEMTVLGRKLYSAFERQPGKVEWINRDIAGELAEKHLSFCYLGKADPDKPSWSLVSGEVDLAHWHLKTPLRESDNLPALICWCLCNGVIDTETQVHLASDHPYHHRGKIEGLLEVLRAHLPRYSYASHPDEHERFESPKTVNDVVIFVGNSSQTKADQPPGLRHVDVVSINSWGEVVCTAFTGDDAVARTLQHLLSRFPDAGSLPPLHIHPFSKLMHDNSCLYFETLLREALDYYHSKAGPGRFIFSNASRFYLMQRFEHSVDFRGADSYAALIRALGEEQAAYSDIRVASNCHSLAALNALLPFQNAGSLQAFFHRREDVADLFVMDPSGALHYQAFLCDETNVMLAHLQAFIRHLQRSSLHCAGKDAGINWFRLRHDGAQWVATPMEDVPRVADDSVTVRIAMLAQRSQDTSHRFDLSVNERTFHFTQHGKEIIKRAARYIREEFPAHAGRLCYVHAIQYSELVDSAQFTARLALALHHKAQIEEALNSALLAYMPEEALPPTPSRKREGE